MIGQTLNNRYEITARIGKGAMGAVYRATDIQTRQEVAVKVISGDLAVDPEMLERFKREGEALRKLKHPNIVGFLDAFQHEERHVIVMEYVPGGSLYELLKQGPLPIERARQIALDLCDALIRAHRLNIIHRDIKPENILIDEDGTPKLADFGVARLAEGTRMTRSGMQVGTPYYMAPEAWKGETLDGQADVWSLGVVLFEMLAGQVPFDGDTGHAVMTKVFSTQPPDLKKLRTETPSALVKIVSRMLTRDKKRRYQTMRQVGVDLESGQLSGTPKPAKPAKRVDWSKARASIINLRKPVITAFLIIGIVMVIYLLSKSGGLATMVTNLPDLSRNPGSQTISEKDGMRLVYVPAGEFTMGTDKGDPDEEPAHKIYLDEFWIDQTEVTNAMYAKCVNESVCPPPSSLNSYSRADYYDNPEYDDYPVVYVNWERAVTYCSWAGRRLPTEAEWEKAARGGDDNQYPWGNESPDDSLMNFNNNLGDTSKVGSYPDGATIYGAFDMGGNVWEWVSDWYTGGYYRISPSINPLGPYAGEEKVLRGGAWNYSDTSARTTNRHKNDPTVSYYGIGFRCVVSKLP